MIALLAVLQWKVMRADVKHLREVTHTWQQMTDLSLVECDMPWGNPDLKVYGPEFTAWTLEKCQEYCRLLADMFAKSTAAVVVSLAFVLHSSLSVFSGYTVILNSLWS
jgi:hypothetical protein